MTELEFWQFKLLQLLHDPPGKPLARWYRQKKASRRGKQKGGHKALADELLKTIGADPDHCASTRPDYAATGADRPVVGFGQICKVMWGQKDATPLCTHPLCSSRLQLDLFKSQPRVVWPGESYRQQKEVIEGFTLSDDGWNEVGALRATYAQLWRLLSDELIRERDSAANGKSFGSLAGDLAGDGYSAEAALWSRMPADTRIPDHSVWEHNRVTAALCFLEGKPLPPEREPYLLSFSLGPVQDFIQEARTGRDLWTGSMILADLSWHSMLPVVKQYGLDAVLSPSLHGNPMVDRWLADHAEPFGQLAVGDPFSYAAMLPHHWVAVVPLGGADHLEPLAKLAKDGVKAVQERWSELEGGVRRFFEDECRKLGLNPKDWGEQWEAQHSHVMHATWTAVHWKHHPGTAGWSVGGALPAQDLSRAPRSLSAEEDVDLSQRMARLRPWLPEDAWSRYEAAREVFARTTGTYLKGERGFDYALTHHQLQVSHAQRKATRIYPRGEKSGGERCTMCGIRTALGPQAGGPESLDGQRASLRKFWERVAEALGEPNLGQERLCAVCLVKRLLVPTGNPEDQPDDFNRMWTGDSVQAARSGMHQKLRAPFPSTAAVAAQRFLRAVAPDPALANKIDSVTQAAGRVEWPRTFFARSLASTAALPHSEFLELEPQLLYRWARDAELKRRKVEGEDARALHREVDALLDAARGRQIPMPGSRFALVAMDGDGLGRLQLGEAGRIRATWADVLHPLAVRQLLEHPTAVAAGWPALLHQPRLIGPSLHAYISRALADFAHRIVPWVVEREFHGRLIYAGGDDLLAMVDAEDALSLAARLQQLYAAPWVVDTLPGCPSFAHRHQHEPQAWNPDLDRGRFVIPEWNVPGDDLIELSSARTVDPIASEGDLRPPVGSSGIAGEVMGMLGPYQSLSAGIVFAHFKTPLRGVIREAQTLLDHRAKETAGKAAFAAALWTRGGIKSSAVLPWYESDDHRARGQLEGHRLLLEVRDAFRAEQLPGRLPYKLREMSWAFKAADASNASEDEREKLRLGILSKALRDLKLNERLTTAISKLWALDDDASALLLARGLARDVDEEGEE